MIRHAKAKRSGHNDHDRALSTRGDAQCLEMADVLMGSEHRPDTFITSSALRAYTTATQLTSEIPDARLFLSEALYTFSSSSLLATLLYEIEEHQLASVSNLGVVGHNSAISDCIEELTHGKSMASLPTLGIAVLSFEGEWSQLFDKEMELVCLLRPKS